MRQINNTAAIRTCQTIALGGFGIVYFGWLSINPVRTIAVTTAVVLIYRFWLAREHR